MQSEQDWAARIDADEESGSAERYLYFMRPEPFGDLGPIQEIEDEYLGKTLVRDMSVGMVRNAKDENKKQIVAYLRPFPHTRIEKAKDLQGWYQSKNNIDPVTGRAHRPRPCFTDAILTEPYGGFCQVGCSFSLPAGELIETPTGPRKIEDLREGDRVYGRTLSDRRAVVVLGATKHVKPEGIIVVTLSDGRQLRLTGDHPVYSTSRGWVAAETLQRYEGLEDETMSRLRESNSVQEVVSYLLAGVQQEEAEASKTLPRLRRGVTQVESDSLRRLQFEDQIRQRKEDERKTTPRTETPEVGRNNRQDERARDQESREHVSASARAEISGILSSKSRGCSERDFWLQNIEEASLYRSEGPDFSHAIGLGGSCSSTFRCATVQLGLRAIFYRPSGRFCLPSRFCTETLWDHYRSKRLHDGRGGEKDSNGRRTGLSRLDNGSKDDETVRHPYVVRIERIPGATWVYDIETETGNFYQRGILVHNCYVNSGMRGYRGSGLITVPLNYGEQIKRQLKMMRRATAGYFSSFTDPFLPLENYYHNTEEASREFVDVGLPIFFLSRLRYPDWAVELLQQNEHSYAQKSINTCDPEDWRKLSPGALPLEEHFEDIKRLKKAGIYVSIQCNPIIPGVTSNEQIVKLFKRLADVGADHVIVKFVEAGYSWAPAMVQRTVKRFGDRGKRFEELFTDNIGGQRTVQEEYRLKAHRLYSTYAKRYGLTYATCYEYKYERDGSGNIKDKTGISIGREFTTAAQCHGHRVPMYARTSADEPFKPLEECPPSGCLYCASENDGKPRCGDDLAGEAKALRLVDLKVPFAV